MISKNHKNSFEQLHKENADDREVIFALGLLAIEAKDGDLAKQYFKKLLRGGDPNGQAAYFMGLTEKLNNNIEAALSWFASVPAKSPRFDAAQNHYITLLAENDQLAKARKHIADIRKANPQLAVQYYLYEATFLREQNQQQASFDFTWHSPRQNTHNKLIFSTAGQWQLNQLIV